MKQRETTLTIAGRGIIAGLIGTAAITAAVKSTPKVLRRIGVEPPLDERSEDEPTERLTQLVLEFAGVKPAPQGVIRVGGQVIHWGYGALWGAIFALLQPRVDQPSLAYGLLLSLPTAVVYSFVAPALHIVPERDLSPRAGKALMFAFQLLYGVVTALALRRLSGRSLLTGERT